MKVARIDRQRAIRASERSYCLLLRLSFSLAALNLVWAFPKSAFAAEPAVTVTVLVFNYARVSPGALAAAEREASRILGAAGVWPIWLECPMRSSTAAPEGPCLRGPESTDIKLRVLTMPIQNSFEDTVFGFTVRPILASVYYDYAVRLARSEGVEFDARKILGCVIAHELGHLLLGPNSHSSTGIMQSPWGREQVREVLTGTLLFTPEQAKLMRAQALTRTRLQTEDPERGTNEIVDSTGPRSLVH